MKRILFLALLALPLYSAAQNFVYSKYDEQGRMTVSYSGTDSKNYIFTRFYENGMKMESGRYKDGVKHGSWKSWSEDGKLESKARYDNGSKSGKWVIYNSGERQIFHISFEENKIKTASRKDKNGHVLAKR